MGRGLEGVMDPRVPVPDYTRLLVRKFPTWLKSEDKESLLRCFGAVDIAVMSQNGRMVVVLMCTALASVVFLFAA